MESYVYIEGKKYKRGYTTGTCAVAGATAAMKILLGEVDISEIEVVTPKGIKLTLPLENIEIGNDYAVVSVRKDGGDDIDVTHGLEIRTKVTWKSEKGIKIDGGVGVGRVTQRGLNIPVGEAAINETPRRCIAESLELLLENESRGVLVEVSVPEGEEAAKKTFNPRLGIRGGISIIGTSGIVEPMSEEGWKNSLLAELKMRREQGAKEVFLVPGNHGERFAREEGIDERFVIRTSNFIGFMLREAALLGFEKVILAGHVGKLVKVASGIFHTHSHIADARMETLMAHLALMDAPVELQREVYSSLTTEAAEESIVKYGFEEVYKHVAESAAKRARQHVRDEMQVEVILFSMDGRILGASSNAFEMVKNWRNTIND